jgi:hypothetical protein
LLDVVDVPLGTPVPLPHQPENVSLGPGGLQLVRVPDRNRVVTWLRDRARVTGDLLDFPTSKAISVNRASQGLHQSLDLVLVTDPKFYRPHERDYQVRVKFELGRRHYDLSVTDPVLRDRSPTSDWRPGGEWLFVISISEPFKDSHWLLVAGCIEVG